MTTHNLSLRPSKHRIERLKHLAHLWLHKLQRGIETRQRAQEWLAAQPAMDRRHLRKLLNIHRRAHG